MKLHPVLQKLCSVLRLLFCSVLLNGCLPAFIHDPELLLSKEQSKELQDYRIEVEVGRNIAGRLLQYYGSITNEAVLHYVNQVGQYLARFNDVRDRRYMFAVLDTNSINVFACPGGYILLTKGALKTMKNEAELAGMLSHAIAHVGKKHLFLSIQEQFLKNAEDADLDPYMEIRRRGSLNSTTSRQSLVSYLEGSTGMGEGYLLASKEGLSLLLQRGLNDPLEFETDALAVQLAARASYDPFALPNYLKRLSTLSENTKILFSTHPKVSERIEKLTNTLRNMHASEMLTIKGEHRFQSQTQSLKGQP